MRTTFRHLIISDRRVISNMKKKGWSNKQIAEAIGVHPSTISRELKRNSVNKSYCPDKAQELYEKRRQACVYRKQWHPRLWEYVVGRIKQGFSPDSIAGRLRLYCKSEKTSVSHQTIYNYIRKGWLGERIQHYLPYGRKGYMKCKNTEKRLNNTDKKRIDEMPDEFLNPTEVGHIQGDTIVGAKQKGRIATFVDITSKYIAAAKMKDGTADSFTEAKKKAFAQAGIKEVRSMLQDNGSEMANYKVEEEIFGCPIYFTFPGRPWEKALIENTNRLLRRFLPKGKPLDKVTDDFILQIVTWLNDMPRKSLNYRTAYEAFHNLEPVAFEI